MVYTRILYDDVDYTSTTVYVTLFLNECSESLVDWMLVKTVSERVGRFSHGQPS